MPESPDARLLERLRGGDEGALAEIYDNFCDRLYRTAIGLCGSRDDAEDLVHDTFVGLWSARARIALVDDLTAYLFASLRHAATRQRQRRNRRQAIVNEIQRQSQQMAAPTQSCDRQDIAELLQTLSTEQREIVVMKIYGGLTFAEAAAILNISANTAASRYRYALEKLRDRLTAENAQHE